MLTIYDACFAHHASQAGVDILFVGDSLGMTIKGESTTISVSLEEMAYHTRCVAKGNHSSILMSDMPFMSYYTHDKAAHAAKVLFQSGAEIVKIEGNECLTETIHFLTKRGIPVCAHIGLTPQFIHLLGGYKIQGKNEEQAHTLLNTAISLEQAGANMLVVECIPYPLAAKIAASVAIPVIGIGAGPSCDGQVLVVYDILGLTPGKTAKFVKNFLIEANGNIQEAIQRYVLAVQQHTFPTLEHSFQ